MTKPTPRDLPALAPDAPIFAGSAEPFADWEITECPPTLEEWRELNARPKPEADALDDVLVAAITEGATS